MQNHDVIICSDADEPPMGNYIVMLLMSVVFAAQFLGDPHAIHLNGLILKNPSCTAFFGHFWLHTGLIHIVSNLLLLAVFGRWPCIKIGNAKYFLIYIVLGITAAFAHILFDGRPVIGASGAIFGVLGMTVVLSFRKFSPFGPWLVFIWFAVSLGAAVVGNNPIAHIAHIGGFVMGMILAIILVAIGNWRLPAGRQLYSSNLQPTGGNPDLSDLSRVC